MTVQTLPSFNTTTNMRLLDGVLRQLIGNSLDMDNLRDDYRQPIHAPLALGVCQGSDGEFRPLYRGWGLDLSRHGTSLVIENPIPLGMELFVDLKALVGRRCIIPCRVVYCHRLLTSTYRIGISFTIDNNDEPELKIAR